MINLVGISSIAYDRHKVELIFKFVSMSKENNNYPVMFMVKLYGKGPLVMTYVEMTTLEFI